MTYSFYATFDVDGLASYIPAGIPILLPASSWARDGLKPPIIPSQVTAYAADSGGYVASKIWGDYLYTDDEYVNWLLRWRPGPPQWAAMKDFCCEPELCQVTKERQDRTTANARQMWEQYRAVPFVWVPTIQGLEPQDYQRHALELADLIAEMQQFYTQRGQADVFRVGIGTLCRRADSMTIRAIVAAIRAILPEVAFHLWGVKLGAIRALDIEEMGIESSDSATWHDLMYNTEAIRAEAAAAGMSQRRYCIERKLPAYVAKITAAAALPASLPNDERERATEQVRAAIVARGWTYRPKTRRAREYVYAVRRNGPRLEERYLGPLSNAAAASALAAVLPNNTPDVVYSSTLFDVS